MHGSLVLYSMSMTQQIYVMLYDFVFLLGMRTVIINIAFLVVQTINKVIKVRKRDVDKFDELANNAAANNFAQINLFLYKTLLNSSCNIKHPCI